MKKKVVTAAKARHKILKDKIWPVFKELVDEDVADNIAQNTVGGEGTEGEGGNPEQAIENELSAGGKAEMEQLRQNPGTEMSPELAGEIRKIFESLPKAIQQKILERAIRMIAEIEDKIIEELRSQISDETIETNHEVRVREEQEEAERHAEADRDKIEQEIEKKKIEQLDKDLNVYNQYFDAVRDLSRELFEKLEDVLVPNVKTKTRRVTTGQKLNLKALYRFKSGLAAGATQIDDKIFEVTHQPEKKDYVFTILCDLSGSMSVRGKIQEAFKAVILFAETINRLGIRVEVLGFEDILIEYKSFAKELDNEVRLKMQGMLLEPSGENPGGRNSGDNWDGPCLREASGRLGAQAGHDRFLIVISDGQPAGGAPLRKRGGAYIFEEAREALREAVEDIMGQTDQKLIGIGLGPDTAFVKDYYPVSLPGVKIKELVKTLGQLVEDLIEHPESFRSKQI